MERSIKNRWSGAELERSAPLPPLRSAQIPLHRSTDFEPWLQSLKNTWRKEFKFIIFSKSNISFQLWKSAILKTRVVRFRSRPIHPFNSRACQALPRSSWWRVSQKDVEEKGSTSCSSKSKKMSINRKVAPSLKSAFTKVKYKQFNLTCWSFANRRHKGRKLSNLTFFVHCYFQGAKRKVPAWGCLRNSQAF